MQRFFCLAAAVLLIASCAEKPKVNVTSKVQKVQTASRSEPIFYNGKTYRLRYSYNETLAAFDMKVSGETARMTDAQQKDAEAIATSSLRYFACPDGQSGRLSGNPRYGDGTWALQARCA
jgi:hypothetical protein